MSEHKHIGWGLLMALFGVFFLIANLLPGCGILKFWPIFLIAGGLLKVFGGGCCGSNRR